MMDSSTDVLIVVIAILIGLFFSLPAMYVWYRIALWHFGRKYKEGKGTSGLATFVVRHNEDKDEQETKEI